MVYSPRFVDALFCATRLHSRQTRKGNEAPYITHLMAVVAIVGENGGSEDQVIAALLHDAVEDQGGLPRLEEIRLRFGGRVADLVAGCTDAVTLPKPPWRERKEKYLEHLRQASQDLLLVSAADKLHNARSILADLRQQGPACFEKFTGRREGTLLYYWRHVQIFRDRIPGPLTESLAETVKQIVESAAQGLSENQIQDRIVQLPGP